MDCTDNKEFFVKTLRSVGRERANILIEKYGEAIPHKVLIDNIIEFNRELSDMEVLKKHHRDMSEFVPDIGVVNTSIINKALFKFKNELASTKESIKNGVESYESTQSKIFELQENIEKINSTSKLSTVLTVAESSLNSWINSGILSNKEITASSLNNGFNELDMLDSIISDFLVYKSDSLDKLDYKIENKSITDKAEEIQQKIIKTRSKLKAMSTDILLKEMNSILTNKVSINDLNSYIDISSITRLFMDASRTKNKIANFVHKVLNIEDKNIQGEFNETLNLKLKELEEAAGLDLTKKKDLEQFLQKDEKGETIPYLITEYSTKYYKHIEKLQTDIDFNERYHRNFGAKNKKAAEKTKGIIKSINDTLNIVDTEKLISNNDDIRNREIKRLEDLVGSKRAGELIRKALKGYEDYSNGFNRYKESLEFRRNSKMEEDLTISRMNMLLDSYKEKYNPLILLESIRDGFGNINKSTFNKLAFFPKKEINSVDSEFYDNRFYNIKNNKAKYDFYNFYVEARERFLSYLPEYSTSKLKDNYLPDIFKDSTFDLLSGNNIGSSILNEIKKGVSSKPIDSSVVYGILTSDNKKKKRIPIRYVDDTISNLDGKISRIKNKVEILKDKIDTSIGHVKFFESQLLPDTHAASKIYNKELLDRIKSIKSSINYNVNSLGKLENIIPKLIEMRNKKIKSKSTDIVSSLKELALMSLNYKYKSKVVDVLELTRRHLHENASSIAGSNDKSFTNKIGEFILNGGESELNKMIDYNLDSMLYGEYKETKTFTDKLVATTEESNRALAKYKALKKELEDKLENKEISVDDYIGKLEEAKLEINKVDGIRAFTLDNALDYFNSFIYKLNLGWNPSSAAANVAFGRMANRTEASANRFFDNDSLDLAYKQLQSSALKSLTGYSNEMATKIYHFLTKFGTAFELLEDSYGRHSGLTEKQKKYGFLNPMEGIRRGEYHIQGAVSLAMANKIKLKTIDGKEVSLFDALDKHANMRKDIISEKDIKDWSLYNEDGLNNKAIAFRMRAEQLVKRLHGNYAASSPMMVKKYSLGRLLMTFKSFMPEGFATRFEKEGYDEQLEHDVKGRYRTYGTLGFSNSVNVLRGIFMEKYFRQKLNLEDKKYSTLDIENMRRNFVELQWGLVSISIALLARAFFTDDEEKSFAVRHALDLNGRLIKDIELFINPLEVANLSKSPLSQLTVINQVAKMPEVLYNYTFSDNKHHNTEYLIRNGSKITPGLKQFYRTFFADLNRYYSH